MKQLRKMGFSYEQVSILFKTHSTIGLPKKNAKFIKIKKCEVKDLKNRVCLVSVKPNGDAVVVKKSDDSVLTKVYNQAGIVESFKSKTYSAAVNKITGAGGWMYTTDVLGYKFDSKYIQPNYRCIKYAELICNRVLNEYIRISKKLAARFIEMDDLERAISILQKVKNHQGKSVVEYVLDENCRSFISKHIYIKLRDNGALPSWGSYSILKEVFENATDKELRLAAAYSIRYIKEYVNGIISPFEMEYKFEKLNDLIS